MYQILQESHVASGDHIGQDGCRYIPSNGNPFWGEGLLLWEISGLLVSGNPAGHSQVLWLAGELPSLPNVTLISTVVPMLSHYLISGSY